MDHEIPNLERRGRLGRLDDFDQRLFAKARIAGAYINVVSKWCMKGISFDAEFLDPASGPSHHISIVVIKMRGKGTNLNDIKTAPTDRFQTIKDAMLGETTGG